MKKFAILFTALLVVSGCVRGKDEIGVVLPLTGPLSFVGESARNGLMLRLEHEPSKYEVNIVDGKGTARDSISAYRLLASKSNIKSLFCVGSVAAKAICEQVPNMPVYMTIVSDSKVGRNNDSCINFTLNNEQEVDTLLRYFIDRNKTRMALIYQQDDLGLYTRQTVERNPRIQMVAVHELSDETQVQHVVSQIQSSRPDFVFVATVGRLAAITIKRLVEVKFNGELASFSGFNTPSVLKQAGRASESVVVCCTRYDISEADDIKNFKLAYNLKYGRDPDFIAAYSYSLMQLFLSGDVKSRKYKTLFGDVERNLDGTLNFPLFIGMLRSGRVVKVKDGL